MKAITTIAVLVIMVMMSGTTVAEGDQTYGIMNMCPDCTDAGYDTASLPCEHSETSSAEADVAETGEIPANGIEEGWAFGRRNFIPNNISGIMYDFEEGSNCLLPFRNKHPDVATFLTVLGTQPYGCDEPSYSSVGGSMCGTTRCYMNIYPYPNRQEWIYVVNGRVGFNPITCCNSPDCWLGDCYPSTRARIQFKDDTHYVSFLASTGGDLRVRLYSVKGKRYDLVHWNTIPVTIFRNGTEPSNFTRYSVYLPDIEIARMDLSGGFNAWHIDDLVVGGGPGYVPEPRTDYGWAAKELKKLIGAEWFYPGLGYNLYTGTFLDATAIKDEQPDPYWDPWQKEMLFAVGICPEAALIWAFNKDGNLINVFDLTDQYNKEFTEDVEYWNTQPGDTIWIDYPPADGIIDEVAVFIEPQMDDTGTMVEDIIRIIPEQGVHYTSHELIYILYGKDPTGIFDYRSLSDDTRNTKSPFPKMPGKPI